MSNVFIASKMKQKYIICAERTNLNNKATPKGQCPASRVTYCIFLEKHTIADRVYNNINNKTSFTYTEKEHKHKKEHIN